MPTDLGAFSTYRAVDLHRSSSFVAILTSFRERRIPWFRFRSRLSRTLSDIGEFRYDSAAANFRENLEAYHSRRKIIAGFRYIPLIAIIAAVEAPILCGNFEPQKTMPFRVGYKTTEER